MGSTTWHNYGYGICTSKLCVDSVERIENLLRKAPDYRRDVHELFKELEIVEPQVEDYLEIDQDYMNGIATILREVILEATGVNFVACDDYDGHKYLIYMPLYPWQMLGKDRRMTMKKLDSIFKKFIGIISDTELEIDFQEVENGG